MSQQLPLALGLRARQQLDAFIPGGNQAALAAIGKLLDGQERQLFLAGPQGAGKSHLLLGVCAAAERRGEATGYLPLADRQGLTPDMLAGFEDLAVLAIDDVDQICGDDPWERSLFGLYNRARSAGARLLFAAAKGPAALALELPDLRSRLAWGLSFAVQPLDDDGRHRFLIAEAGRRGLELSHEAARYLLTRCSRNPTDLLNVMDHLDQAAMAEQRRLTLPFVSRQLQRRIQPD
jgi:DnaA family protein